MSRINAAANAVVQTITASNIPDAIASGPSGIWVANQGDATVDQINPATGDGATLDRIDPHTNRVSRVISLGSTPRGIVATGSGVWVAARPFAARPLRRHADRGESLPAPA